MPTTKLKNTAYRLMLPLLAPSSGRHPVSSLSGHPIRYLHSFEYLIRRHHVLGSSVLLASDGITALICTSSADPRHLSAPDSFYRVASITKTATSLLTMRLCDDRILDQDCPVGSYFAFPALHDMLDGITLRHLLSHTSGLIDPPGLESFLEKGIPFTEILPQARQYKPGSSFHYSNLGFGLIGSIMEAATGQPVGKLFRDCLFSPLGMKATLEGCLLPPEKIMPVSRVLPYRPGHDLILTRLGSVPLTEPDPLRHYGHTAGSMYTDIFSLHKLLDVLITNSEHFLPDHLIRDLCSEHASYGKLSPSLSYGYGLLRINDPSVSDSTVLGHQGFAYGCADGAFWEQDTGRVMIILNGGSSEARTGRLGLLNRDLLRWSFRKELPSW